MDTAATPVRIRSLARGRAPSDIGSAAVLSLPIDTRTRRIDALAGSCLATFGPVRQELPD